MNFYKGNPDSINFTEIWTSEATYLEKIKVVLTMFAINNLTKIVIVNDCSAPEKM